MLASENLVKMSLLSRDHVGELERDRRTLCKTQTEHEEKDPPSGELGRGLLTARQLNGARFARPCYG